MEQFSYYMIRVRHSPAASVPEPLAGIVERLGSGEKASFSDGEALLRLLGGWSRGFPNMRTITEGGKPEGSDSLVWPDLSIQPKDHA